MEIHTTCRHYKPCPVITDQETGAYFWCLKHQQAIRDCQWCRVCPRCDGKMAYERIENRAIFTSTHETMRCVHCGYYAAGERLVRRVPPLAKSSHLCAVVTCLEPKAPNTFCEHQQICTKHKHQMYRWATRKMPEERKPLLLIDGKLHQNQEYMKKESINYRTNKSAAKLSYQIAVYVREQLREGTKSQVQLAAELKVHVATISHIWKNRVWREELWG